MQRNTVNECALHKAFFQFWNNSGLLNIKWIKSLFNYFVSDVKTSVDVWKLLLKLQVSRFNTDLWIDLRKINQYISRLIESVLLSSSQWFIVSSCADNVISYKAAIFKKVTKFYTSAAENLFFFFVKFPILWVNGFSLFY